MSDIININVGQVGLRTGDHFWKVLRQQHKIDADEQEGRMSFFKQTKNGWEARSMFVDLSSKQADKIRMGSQGLHNHDNIITADMQTQGTFGEVYYNCYPQIKQELINRLKKNVQNCDNFSGFIINSSLEGSVGSGLGYAILYAARDDYSDRVMQYFRLMPDLHLNTHPVNAYNSVFSLVQDINYCDLNLLYDNSAVHKQLARRGNLRPTCDQLNSWIGSAIAQTTIPFRFSGCLNTSQRKIITNTVIFSRMHFSTFSVSQGTANPLLSALAPENYLLTDYYTASPQKRTFTICANSTSPLASQNQVYQTVNKQFSRRNYHFVDWMRNVHISLTPRPEERATLIASGYHVNPFFHKMLEMFTAPFRRKAFIYRYLMSGMDQMQFVEAESNLSDLVSEYTPPSNYLQEGEEEIQ